MNLNSKYRKKERVVCRQIADEHFLVPVCVHPDHMQNIFVLNPAAVYIWQHMDGMKTLEEILFGITDNFEVTKEQAGPDMMEFISRLLEADLIEGVA